MLKLLKSAKAAMVGTMMQVTPGMITCREFDDFLVDYIDEALTNRQQRLFRLHLKVCPHCREYINAYMESRKLGKMAFADGNSPLPDTVPDALVEAVVATLNKSS